MDEKDIDKMEGEECTCDLRDYEDHSCPFQEDINNECELPYEERSMCQCCPYCTYQCCMDI